MFEERYRSNGGMMRLVCTGACDVYISGCLVSANNIIHNIPELPINMNIMWNDTKYSITKYIYYANRYT